MLICSLTKILPSTRPNNGADVLLLAVQSDRFIEELQAPFKPTSTDDAYASLTVMKLRQLARELVKHAKELKASLATTYRYKETNGSSSRSRASESAEAHHRNIDEGQLAIETISGVTRYRNDLLGLARRQIGNLLRPLAVEPATARFSEGIGDHARSGSGQPSSEDTDMGTDEVGGDATKGPAP